MDHANGREEFIARCRRAADAARSAGLGLQKAAGGRQALEISRGARSVEFPIISDERAWLLTTVEEAFYATLRDARDAEAVRLSAAAATLDEADRAVLPAAAREVEAARERATQLADLLGGRAPLEALLAEVDSSAL